MIQVHNNPDKNYIFRILSTHLNQRHTWTLGHHFSPQDICILRPVVGLYSLAEAETLPVDVGIPFYLFSDFTFSFLTTLIADTLSSLSQKLFINKVLEEKYITAILLSFPLETIGVTKFQVKIQSMVRFYQS